MPKLTAKQRKFVAVYDGNGTRSARLAGYAGTDGVLAQVAHENLRKPEIVTAIEAREAERNGPAIKRREELQVWWSGLVDDEARDLSTRLRASELLAKSQGVFLERREITMHEAPRTVAEIEAELRELAPEILDALKH